MRVAVIGNCQSEVIGRALSASSQMLVEVFELGAIRTKNVIGEVAAKLPDFDVVLLQDIDALGLPVFAPFLYDSLTANGANVTVFPYLAFTGFHPDCIALAGPGGIIRSPAGSYQSALIAAAFALGLPERQTELLFNTFMFIYERLGYLDRFVSDKMALERQLTKYGLDGVGLLRGWRGQTFMHTFNHPAGIALEGLAKALASRLGFAPESVSLHGLDPLSESTRWPVYPEIARRIGVEGALEFKRPEVSVCLNLSEMIVQSYALLERHRDAVVTNPRVSAMVKIIDAELTLPYVA